MVVAVKGRGKAANHISSHGCCGQRRRAQTNHMQLRMVVAAGGGDITHMKFEWFEAAKRGRAKKLNHMKLRMVVAAKGGEK